MNFFPAVLLMAVITLLILCAFYITEEKDCKNYCKENNLLYSNYNLGSCDCYKINCTDDDCSFELVNR